MKRLWHITGSVKLTFWLLLAVSLLLTLGSYSVSLSPQIFKPLNNTLLQDWLRAYGRNNLPVIWWLFLLLALLGMLGINTVVCVINRLSVLWKTRRQMTSFLLFHRITPSLAHICFLLMLIGHFLSMTTGFHQSVPLVPGASFSLPDGMRGDIVDHYCERYDSPEVLSGSVKQCAVTMKLQDREIMVKQISLLDPFSREGVAFHLGMDKNSAAPDLKLSVKQDPGVPLILYGFSVLVLLMVWYYLLENRANT